MNRSRRRLLGLLCTLGPVSALGAGLEAADVFRFGLVGRMNDIVEFAFFVQPGHALYAHKIQIVTDSADVRVGALKLPNGERRFDETLGQEVTYLRGAFRVFARLDGKTAKDFHLIASVQGCSDDGLCYVPFSRRFKSGPML